MKKYKMIVTDIDGTLLNAQHHISDENKVAIQSFIEAGNTCELASGRPTKGMWSIVDELDLTHDEAYILSYNGSHLVNTKTRKTVYEHNLSNEQFARVAEVASTLDLAFCSYTEDALVVNRPSEEAQIEVNITGLELEVAVDVPAYFADKSIPKSIIFSKPEDIQENEKKIKALMGDDVEVFPSSDIFIEIMPKGIHKGAGILELSKMFDVPVAEIISIGDGGNDVSMIKQAGLGIAVANAIPVLKEAADVLTVDHNEHALAAVIDKYFM